MALFTYDNEISLPVSMEHLPKNVGHSMSLTTLKGVLYIDLQTQIDQSFLAWPA